MGESTARILVTADDKASPVITSVQGRMQGLAAEAKKSILTGVGLAGGVSAFNVLKNAAGAAVDYLGDAVRSASALNESQDKANVVFGSSAGEITRWAATASKAFGQSKQQALEAVGTYGNLFQAFGVGREESAKMSKSLVQLAADLASFNNTSVDDALVALRSGLSGETEPLKRYGIALSDARMRQELMAQGMTNLGATLTPLQKSTAAYAIIMHDSALAQGDFARTSDGLANSQRTLDAELADLSADIGTMLLPIIKELTIAARDHLVPALRSVIQHAKDAKPVLDALGFAFGFLTAPIELLGDAVTAAADIFDDGFSELPVIVERGVNASRKALAAAGKGMVTEAGDIGEAIPAVMADAMLAGQFKLKDATAQLVRFMAEGLSPAQERAQALAFLASNAYGQAMASGVPVVVKKATELRNAALGVLGQTGGAFTGGMNLATAWKNGLLTGLEAARIAMIRKLGQLKANLYGMSPPKEGPLRDIDKGAFNIGKAWSDAFGQGLALARLPALGAHAGFGGGGGMSLAGAGGGGAAPIHIHIEGPVFGDGPFLDMLANKISDRLRFAPGT